MNRVHTLGKAERLKRRKVIESLFGGGQKCQAFPLRALFGLSAEAGLRVGVTASSRSFPRAVDRNRIKRWMREAWRLEKEALRKRLMAEGRGLDVFIIYTGKEGPEASLIREKTLRLLHLLNQWLDENPVAAA
jgi:ribonuclease P protein component